MQEHPTAILSDALAIGHYYTTQLFHWNHHAGVFEQSPKGVGSEHWTVHRNLHLLAESGGSAYARDREELYGIKLWTMVAYR